MKKFFACFFIMLFSFTMVACNSVKTKEYSATIVFEGAGTITVSSTGGSYEIPELALSSGQTLLGWALKEGSTKPLVVEEVTYEDIADYVSDNTLHLYPVIESKIEVTIHGVTDIKTSLSNISLNQATLPLVEQTERQQFLGWAIAEDADSALIDASTTINYSVVESLAVNAKVDLYPVIESYDLMICVHGSHSNGNVYVSPEQRATLKEKIESYFADENINILIDYVDAVSAKNFAAEAVKKDYDILLTSKTARNQGETAGDIATAAIAIGKTYYAEADADETVLTCIELNQSRQVCRMLGSNNEKPYQEQAYAFFTTPIDYVVQVTFVNGELSETIDVHRVVNGVVSSESYLPENEAIISAEGKVFDGWTTVEGGTEVEFPNASYANIYQLAVDGKVTLYPVFAPEPDAYFVVWGVNGSNEYVSEEQFATMQELFDAYIAAHNISLDGKKVQFEYFVGKTAEFQSKLTLDYVSGAVGAAALSNDTYANYWTISLDYYAQVVNVACTNASRYVALRDSAVDNEIALAFFNALCEATIEVQFAYGEYLSEAQEVNSVTKNVLDLPEAIEVPAGQALIGFGLSAEDTEPTITGNISYATVKKYATDGKIVVYPIFAAYDLVVYVWGGQSKTGTTYVTEDESEDLKAAFIQSLGDAAQGKLIVFNVVWGKTADYGALVGSEADVIISGPKLNTDDQCGALLDADLGKIEVINVSFSSGSARYAGVCTKALSNDLAKELIIYLCQDSLTVTFDGEEAQTITKVYNEVELVVPTKTPETGYVFAGWATSNTATEAEFTNDGLTFDALAAKATDKAITLYPVFVEEEQGKISVTVAYHEYGSTDATPYFTQAMLTKLQTLLATELSEAGYTSEDYEITWKSYTGKVAAASAAIVDDGADVCIAHTQVFNASKTDTPFVCADAYQGTVFSSSTEGHTFYCASNLKVGVGSSSANNAIAVMIYNILVNYTEE